jgi:hypothetical protein
VRTWAIPPWAVVLTITAAFAVVSWSGIEQWRNGGGDDAYTYRDYVQWLDLQHRIPRRDQNYEYALPIGVPALGLAVQRAFGTPKVDATPSPPLEGLPRLLRRLLWIGLIAGSGLLLTATRRFSPGWLLGAGLGLAATAWALAYVGTAANNEWWLPLVLVSYTAGVLLVPATALLAQEVLPARRWAPALGAAGAVLLPPVFAATLYFHPDPPFALLAVLATALAVHALRTRLTVPQGFLLGVALGGAALARQSAPVIAVALGLAVTLVARRASVRYLVAAACAMLLVVGPWWYQQIERYDNPIQSNLERPGYMLDHQPLSFFVSFPAELVTRPYVPSYPNQLLPRFHSYLWSDWGGGYHHWGNTKRYATTLASVQSVLGLGGDALVLGGFALLGVPALARVASRRDARAGDASLAVLTTLFGLSWLAFVAALVHYPQRDGDPIKVHYLLFLGPVSVVFAIAAGAALLRRGPRARLLLLGWLSAYALSWALTVLTAF